MTWLCSNIFLSVLGKAVEAMQLVLVKQLSMNLIKVTERAKMMWPK